jgi:hypothetical protein
MKISRNPFSADIKLQCSLSSQCIVRNILISLIILVGLHWIDYLIFY